MPLCVLWGAFFIMERYSKITTKNKREIVLLQGRGCAYGKCVFCDYHLDKSADDKANFLLDKQVLANVTGEFGRLEVINSGSVFELGDDTLRLIREICRGKNIGTVHFEAHYMYKEEIPQLRRMFESVSLKMKLGLETFDYHMREDILRKGIDETDPKRIAENFDEANLLFGIDGQSVEAMRRDIQLGLKHFERLCVNIMCENSTKIKPSAEVISDFMREIYPEIREHKRIDILLNNTDFGVGD